MARNYYNLRLDLGYFPKSERYHQLIYELDKDESYVRTVIDNMKTNRIYFAGQYIDNPNYDTLRIFRTNIPIQMDVKKGLQKDVENFFLM